MTHRSGAAHGPEVAPPKPRGQRPGSASSRRKKLQSKFKEQKASGSVDPKLKKRLNLSRIKNLQRRLTNREKAGKDTSNVTSRIQTLKSKRGKLAGRTKKDVEDGPPKEPQPTRGPGRRAAARARRQEVRDRLAPKPASEKAPSKSLDERKATRNKTAASIAKLNTRIAKLKASGASPEKLAKLQERAKNRRGRLKKKQQRVKKAR